MELEKKSTEPIKKVLVKHKQTQSLHEFATMLETIAQKLKEEQKFTFKQGEETIEIQPSNQVKVEYEYEVKGDKHSFEIELDWYPARDDKKVEIL